MNDQIVNEIEQLEAELSGAPAQPKALEPATTRSAKVDPVDLAHKRILEELIRNDPKPYLATHKKCSTCLRHNAKDAAVCELCGSAGKWEPVTCHRPDCLPLGRKHDSLEHLSNLPFPVQAQASHLRWALTWREDDGTKQINAAKCVPTPFVLSYEQRCWCKRLLEWLEPGTTVQEPGLDEPEPQVEAATISTTQPKRRLDPRDLDRLFAYQAWKVEREANGLPASAEEWIAESGQNL